MPRLSPAFRRTLAPAVALLTLAGCADMGPMKSTGGSHAAHQAARLKNFDDLDFNVYSHQRWDQLSRSHAADITVHWPDGRVTHGIDVHIEDLKKMFVFAPDTRISSHPIRIADLDEDYTAVMGVLEGTFTQPMPTPDGKMLPPTGRPFKLEMVTIGHWRGDVMDEEYLFWDNQAFMKQIGLAP